MARKNSNAGQLNRQAQMSRKVRHIENRDRDKMVRGPGSENLIYKVKVVVSK